MPGFARTMGFGSLQHCYFMSGLEQKDVNIQDTARLHRCVLFTDCKHSPIYSFRQQGVCLCQKSMNMALQTHRSHAGQPALQR